MVQSLVDEAKTIIDEGSEARLAAAIDGAAEEAEADRMALFESKGADANHSEEVVLEIRRRIANEGQA
jgi:hypothetical protein